ncbi:YLP motif-containing protein 1-like [Macrobrachium nipponense]|uniref:YLP motif-containing protein 1-like n=1 Tax=Macrobrachium nipponense TaxID=159736 RepID=UPI0030C865A5
MPHPLHFPSLPTGFQGYTAILPHHYTGPPPDGPTSPTSIINPTWLPRICTPRHFPSSPLSFPLASKDTPRHFIIPPLLITTSPLPNHSPLASKVHLAHFPSFPLASKDTPPPLPIIPIGTKVPRIHSPLPIIPTGLPRIQLDTPHHIRHWLPRIQVHLRHFNHHSHWLPG